MHGRCYMVIVSIVLIACASVAIRCRADANDSAHCAAIFDCDLVMNGGFEDELGSLDIDHIVQPSSWITLGHATVLQYGGLDGLPVLSDKEPSVWRSLGNNFLAGGPAGATNRDAMVWQRIDIRPAAERVRQGGVIFTLSAVLGGRAGKPDFGRVWVHFFDEKLNPLTNPVGVEPVLRADRRGRTYLMRHACFGDVPPRARYALVSIKLYSLSGWDNHAYVDNVEFVLPRSVHLKNVERCVASGRDRDDAYAAPARRIDAISAACLDNEYWVLAVLIGISTFLITLCLRAGRRLETTRRSVKVQRFIHFVIATGAALASTLLIWCFLRWQQSLFYERCGLGETPFPMLRPWAHQLAIFCILSAADMLGFIIVFTHAKKNAWHKIALRLLVFTLTAVAALILLIWIKPTSESLDRMNAVVLVLLPFVFVGFIFRDRIRKRRWEEKLVMSLVLLLPVLQPLTALLNVNAINEERIHESERHYFDVNVGEYHGRFTGVLFYAPTALDYNQSARVVFSSHLNDVSDRQPRSCILPRFTAPGFRVKEVSADPAPLSRGRVWWEWVVTPEHDGRQFMFIDVLSSPQCKPSNTAGANSGAGFVTVFSQTDSAWISRQWLSVDNFGSALSLISLLGGVLAIPVAILEMRKHGREIEMRRPSMKEEITLISDPENN